MIDYLSMQDFDMCTLSLARMHAIAHTFVFYVFSFVHS